MPKKINHRKKNKPLLNKPTKLTTLTGALSVNSRGIGYFKPIIGDYKEDIEISAANLGKALNKDTVTITLLPIKKNTRLSGRVINIINRAKTTFVGTIEKEQNKYFLLPDDKKMYVDILIINYDQSKIGTLLGQKALVKIIQWNKEALNPTGEITKILGPAGEHNTEMKSILYEEGFEIDFPPTVELEAERLAQNSIPIPQTEIAKRRDCRLTTTFTIDPKDAKDFDDAISFMPLPNGNLEIGVHIADVSHYVQEKTALDAEALKREFSVYLVDRTIPMLPEALSNNICSLNPNEEKLTFSAIFELTKKAEIISRWFGKTIIKSNKRFTYEAAQEVLSAGQGEFYSELKTLNDLAKKIRQEKVKHGSIDFEQAEVAFELDPNGKPLRIYKKHRLETHKLVEEYMLLANKEVAEFIYKAYKKTNSDSPFIYRIHDLPDNEKISALSIFVKALGYDLPNGLTDTNSKSEKKDIRGIDLQNLFKQIEGKAEESMIKTAAVRSMTKAIYSTKNIGHFGLAFEFYTHFTSPIRRYPDLLVHRLLEKHLLDERLPRSEWLKYEKISALATEKEIHAAEAERDSKKYKQVEYMQDKIGQTFTGTISGVTEWGIYVEETNTRTEGLVRIKDLGDDYYVFDQKNYCLVGGKTKKKFRLGDQVKFTITAADLERKTIDCLLV